MNARRAIAVFVGIYIAVALWLESRRLRRLRERQRWLDAAFDEGESANTDEAEGDS